MWKLAVLCSAGLCCLVVCGFLWLGADAGQPSWLGEDTAAQSVEATPAGLSREEVAEAPLEEGQARAFIPVTGMDCGGCCISIESAVEKLAGIVGVCADYEKQEACVVYETDKVGVEQIVKAINEGTSFKASLPEETG